MMVVDILLIEDDTRLSALVADRLRAEGHAAETAADGDEGLRLASSGRFDLVVVDVMLPGIDGLHVASALRERGVTTPILMLTARDTVDDRVAGLRAGADDYLVKPFAFKELVARIDALARRAPRADDDGVMAVDTVRLDPRKRRVIVAGPRGNLSAK